MGLVGLLFVAVAVNNEAERNRMKRMVKRRKHYNYCSPYRPRLFGGIDFSIITNNNVM
jgi:hypothetical protein